LFWSPSASALWTANIRSVASSVDLLTAARFEAVGIAAVTNALIACWDAKYTYMFWRPVTALRAGDTDGNPKTVQAGVRVSWQVTGVRSDAAIRKHPFKAEEDKPERERGTYLLPEAYGLTEDRGVEWALHPRVMMQMNETQRRRKDN
jgi:hypothetical protein